MLLAVGHALGDGVLMTAREGGKDQLSGVGCALIDVHSGHTLINFADLRHVGEIQIRIDPVAVHVHCEGDSIDISGALAVTEQTALHALCACQNCQLRTGDACAAVVVGMGRDDHAVAVFQMLVAVLDLVRVDMRHTHLDRNGQVDDHRTVGRGLHNVEDGVADLDSVIDFCSGEAFGAVLKQEVALVFLTQLLDECCAVGGDLLDLFLGLVEDLLTLCDRGGIVEVDDRAGRALDGFEGAADDVVTALGQHLNRNVLGDHVLFDQGTQELVLGLTCGWKADFDFLEADSDEHLEELQLLLKAHRNDQSLIAVSQIDTAPGRCFFNVILLDPTVVSGRDGIVSRSVFGSVHHLGCPPEILHFLKIRRNEKALVTQRQKPLRDESP